VISKLLYNLSLTAYQLALKVAKPFHTKAALMQAGRETSWQQLQTDFEPNTKPVAWFHCASLGEFEQARPLIEAFRLEFTGYKILLTFFSPSGYEVRKHYAQVDWVHYLPFDSQKNAAHWFELVQPKLIFFVKYEFWHYYLQEAAQRQIPTISFSAIFRHSQLFFKSYGSFYREILHCFSHIFVQNKNSFDLLQSIGLQQVSIAGDTRFDRVLQILAENKKFEFLTKFKNQQPLLLVGSAWADDMTVLAPVLAGFSFPLKIVIAPHEISENNLLFIEKLLATNQQAGKKTKKILRYSQIETTTNLVETDILLIDNIGMLAYLYAEADFAFIGGAYKDGLHNILEAAVYGMPIFFGNRNYKKFQEAIDLLAMGGAFLVKDEADFSKKLDFYYHNITQRENASLISANYVQANRGGTQKILDYCKLNYQ
jgi:3-deoxy-D-manno-octulosonic-acid transferase